MKIELRGNIHEDLLLMDWCNTRATGDYTDVKITPENVSAAFDLIAQSFMLEVRRYTSSAIGRSNTLYVSADFKRGTIIITAHRSVLDPALNLIKEIPELKKYISWYYQAYDGIDSAQFPLRGPFPTNEFYPWMDRPLKQLAQDFLNSNANVLLLIGPPGTGKTSFIKGLVNDMNADAWLTYDEILHTSDKLYQDFMRPTNDPRVLILEDADVILSSREDGNKAMGRLLNLADGMVSTGSRKIVFSTNIPNIHSIDEALLRPGRCFGMLRFRELNRRESIAACASVKRELTIDMKENETVPLAVAINGRASGSVVLRMGFTE